MNEKQLSLVIDRVIVLDKAVTSHGDALAMLTTRLNDGDVDSHESRIDSLERLYGDVRSEVTEYESTTKQRRTELLARMAAEIAGSLIVAKCGPVDHDNGPLMDSLANASVDVARRILAKCEEP